MDASHFKVEARGELEKRVDPPGRQHQSAKGGRVQSSSWTRAWFRSNSGVATSSRGEDLPTIDTFAFRFDQQSTGYGCSCDQITWLPAGLTNLLSKSDRIALLHGN
jgi:hypothetical protein